MQKLAYKYAVDTVGNPTVSDYILASATRLQMGVTTEPTFSKVPRKILGRFHVLEKS